MPTPRNAFFLAAVISLAGDAIGQAQDRQISPAVREALTQASAAPSDNRFNQLLRSIAGELPLMPIRGEKDKFSWSKVKLNVAGAGLDAMRFKSSLSEPADMMWAFAPPANLESWYIIPADGGRMIGFRTYATEFDVDLPDLPESESNLLHLQSLLGGEIEPGKEYILWFRFASPEPADFHLAIRLIGASERAANHRFAGLSQTVAEQVGLAWPFRYKTDRFQFRPAEE